METSHLNSNSLNRLQDRARQAGISVDEMLERLLNAPPEPVVPDLSLKILAHSTDTVVLFDTDLRYVYANPSMGRLLGLDAASMIGKTDLELGVPQHLFDQFRAAWDEVIATGQEKLLRFESITPQGYRHYEARLTPLYAPDGSLEYLLAVTRDITGTWLIEEAARRNRNILQRMFDNSQILLAYMDAHFNFIMVNERYAQTDHRSRSDFIGKNHFDLYPDPDTKALFDQVLATGEPLTVYGRPFVYPHNPERGITYWDWSLIPVVAPDGTVEGLILSLFDVTRYVNTEEELLIKNRAIDTALTAFALADLAGKLTYVNQAFLKLWKLAQPDEALGKSLADFCVSQDVAHQMLDTIIQTESYSAELEGKCKDGTLCTVAISAGIVHDTRDNPACMLISLHDITLRKENERASLEMERLKGRFQKEQERNTFVQRIISMLSHDLRTHLSVISTSRDILANGSGSLSEEKRTEKLDTIRRQVSFAAELLDDAVNVARGAPIGGGLQLTEIHLDQFCRIILEEISATNHHRHRMIYTNHCDDLIVLIDETLVSRILLNLLTNAIKYSPQGSEIYLELDHDPDFVILRVRDSGIGISEHDLQHIFEPFFRSADVRSINGTGLGLSIVKDCVERHKGTIEVNSGYGTGSTFTVKIPWHN